MSDKSFGDCPSRNIVKNPLLSTAVTGLSIEDLTHNAVLVPVAGNQGLITRSDHQIGTNTQTLAHSDHEFTNLPSGDSNTNVFPPQSTISAYPHSIDHHQPVHHDKKPEIPTSTVSKAPSKSEDDFDVNEYFARLQGTRYVSAPINSNPEQNANLAATEENLEEINLNDDKNIEVQQSLTADIAQNFSQLPTVLPHVASAVFSSFSNMLSYKSREQTPDDRVQSYQDAPVPFQSQGSSGPSLNPGQNITRDTPLIAEDVVKEVAPPPKEPPAYGSTNFRITTKKKYAQIPGLSSGQNTETKQQIAFTPLTQNVPSYFVPTVEENRQIVAEPTGTVSEDTTAITEQKHPNIQETYNIFNPIHDSTVIASDFQPSTFNISMDNELKLSEERLPPPPSTYACHPSTIPPPPMFSTQRTESLPGKTVLPPSVARRIGSNHPVIKPQIMQPMLSEKIFVPTFDPTTAASEIPPVQPIKSIFDDTHSQVAFGGNMYATKPPPSQTLGPESLGESQLTSTIVPGILATEQFMPQPPPGFTAKSSVLQSNVIGPPSKVASRLPPQKFTAIPTHESSANTSSAPILPSAIPSSTPSMFVPTTAPVELKSNIGCVASPPPSCDIFSPSLSTDTHDPILPPEKPQLPPIGYGAKIEGSSLFNPQSTHNVTTAFYNPEIASEPPKSLIEPPKCTEAVNYRMTKKRPQYYSGPIEGVGSISNRIKPVIEAIGPVTFQGALFTPQQTHAEQNVPSAIPFDISKPLETTPLVPQYDAVSPAVNVAATAFEISNPAITHPQSNYEQQYNTAFDLSRPTAESYDDRDDSKETKGFGIIGSLKSKLSSIDINKIQHSVTTFFDPAYNTAQKDGNKMQESAPYGGIAQGSQSNLEIFVPNVQQNSPTYNYDYQEHQNAIYLNDQYYKYPNFQNQGQPHAGHCSNYNDYPTQSSHPTYSNAQHSYPEMASDTRGFQLSASNAHTQGVVEEQSTSDIVNPEILKPKSMDDSHEAHADIKIREINKFEPKDSQIQNTTTIKEKSPQDFFKIESLNFQSNITDLTKPQNTIDFQEPQDIPFLRDPFNLLSIDKDQMPKYDPMSTYDRKHVDLFANTSSDGRESGNEPIGDIFVKKGFDVDKQNISNYGAQSVDLFTKETTEHNYTVEDKAVKYSSTMPLINKEFSHKKIDDMKINSIFPKQCTMFDKKEIIIPKDSLLESLSKDEIPILGVSSVPLFGLSTILTDKSKDEMTPLSDRNSSLRFFDHPHKPEECGAPKHTEMLNRNTSFSFFENFGTQIVQDTEHDQKTDTKTEKTDSSIFAKMGADLEVEYAPRDKDVTEDKDQSVEVSGKIGTATGEIENASELSICETCREVNKSEDSESEDNDVTTHLIENITAPIQLSNPVEAVLTEADMSELTNTEQMKLDAGQFDEISHITEETIETIQVQSATELLEDVDEIKSMNYGWANDVILKEDYNFNIDHDSKGFFSKNSLFFDTIPSKADEIKHHEDLLAKQMTAPSAPPAEEDDVEEDLKSDEAMLDVHSIEQDANKDFPLFEEFVIEPSDTDDDKIDYKENREEPAFESFTNRVEKYKNMDKTEVVESRSLFYDLPTQPITMTSYFDTGNYAADTHYRNTNTMPIPSTMSIPPGFEEEFKKRLALAKLRDEKIRNDMKTVPDTSTQTRTTVIVSYTTAQKIAPTYSSVQDLGDVGFNIEANITKIVDDLSDKSPDTPTAPSLIGARSFDTTADDQPVKIPAFEIPARSFDTTADDQPVKIPAFEIPARSFDTTADDKPVKIPEFEIPARSFDTTADDKPEKIPEFVSTLSSKPNETIKFKLPEFLIASTSKPVEKEVNLPDPINFFSDNTPAEAPESFSRLASYFSTPPKTDHAKSFFELSESQNHYRHASSTETNKYIDLMKDLTSVKNITVSKDQTVRHVNYFTVEYDSVPLNLNKGDTNKDKDECADNDTDKIDLDSVVTNCRYCTQIFDTSFKARTAVNDNSESGTNQNSKKMEPHKEAGRGSVTVNFDGLTFHEEPNEGVAGMSENLASPEYSPVKHHWFYRVDIEDKSIWRGFSVVDSRTLEKAYLNPDLTDQTLVPTDGGRYDVNVIGRLRIPVYWSDKPTNVRRCSWFYKGTTDARYVPYTEPVAEKLEEEYRHGMTTGEWHRRLVLPNGEVVVMHGPSVMVHFLHSDAFSTPPLFSFGKRVYRNPPKIRVSRDQPEKIDHLILLVHGAGEYKCQKDKLQSSSRPRVVRRGHDESEIEDTEPSSIDHLLLLCHGVGSACDMRFRSVEEVVEDFRSTSLQLIQSHYRNSYDQGIVSRVEVLPISWHATLHSGETGVDRRLAQITLDSIPRLRSFTNDTVLDVLFYTSPVFCQTIIDTVCNELNRIYQLFIQRNPSFKGGVSLGGHSLGSVILYDLLCHQADKATDDTKLQADKHFVPGTAGTGRPTVQYPSLVFSPAALYALGSPIAIFECIRGVESLGATFSLPTCKNFFNIFHPYDPIAYRIEPLINPKLRDLKPFLIPHHKGRKRMHLELKDTMARVGADLKQKLFESLRSTWNKWKTQPPTDGQLEKVVEEEMEKENLCEDLKEELQRESELSTPDMLGRLNSGRRVDYVLQEAPLEMINEYLFAMSSHVGYWESEDTMLLMLREIYSALGVQPDSTVPQQNMTVQRTRNVQDETIVVNASDHPSTSHGSI